jgi:amidase
MPFPPVTHFAPLQFVRDPLVVHAGDIENMNPTAMAGEVWKCPTAKAVGESVEQRPTRRAFLGGAAAAALITLATESPSRAMPLKKVEPGTLDFASAGEAARAIRERSISSAELTQRMLDRIAKYNPRLNAVVNVISDQALDEARRRDAVRPGEGAPLHGVPILVKDAFEIAGVPTTAGIEQLAKYRPASDSEVVRRLRTAGAVILGNTNVPFVLNDWQSYNAIYGTTNNPWDLTRTPGGSSGGSSAALAAGLGYLSPGSDRSGSLRVPAHFCGVYGHKPSLNVVPLRGWFPSPPGGPPQLPETLAVAGALARSASDLQLSMQIMGGPEGAEALAYRWAMPAPRQKRLKDYRVGFVLDDAACPVDSPVRKCLEESIATLRRAGVQVREGWPKGVDVKLQYQTYLYMMYAGLGMPPGMKTESLQPLAAKADGSMESLFAAANIDPHGRFLDHARLQLDAQLSWQAAFGDVDVLLMPTSFVAAFPHDHSEPQGMRRLATSMGSRPYLDLIFWNTFATVAGLPSTAAPIGRTPQGLPVGVQILGPNFEDATTIDFAARMAEVAGGFVAPPGFE